MHFNVPFIYLRVVATAMNLMDAVEIKAASSDGNIVSSHLKVLLSDIGGQMCFSSLRLYFQIVRQ